MLLPGRINDSNGGIELVEKTANSLEPLEVQEVKALRGFWGMEPRGEQTNCAKAKHARVPGNALYCGYSAGECDKPANHKQARKNNDNHND